MDRGSQTATHLRNERETSYSIAQLIKIDTQHDEFSKECEDLEDRLIKLNSGELDSELKSQIKDVMAEVGEKKRIKMQKKADEKIKKAELSVISKAFYQSDRKQDRKNRYQKKGMGRCYKHFLRATDSVPDYMKRSLKDMPNNRGYYWKSVACFGKRPAEKGKPTILIDRKRGGIMVIHEWTSSEYNIYEKKGKGKKIRVSNSIRRAKKGEFPREESKPDVEKPKQKSRSRQGGGDVRGGSRRGGGSSDIRGGSKQVGGRQGGGGGGDRRQGGGGGGDRRQGGGGGGDRRQGGGDRRQGGGDRRQGGGGDRRQGGGGDRRQGGGGDRRQGGGDRKNRG